MHATTMDDRTGALTGTFQFDLTDATPRRVRGPLDLRVVAGRAWVTLIGDPDDWFLVPGERLRVPAGRDAMLSGDPCCRVAVAAELALGTPSRPRALGTWRVNVA